MKNDLYIERKATCIKDSLCRNPYRTHYKKLIAAAGLSFLVWSLGVAGNLDSFRPDGFFRQAAWWGSLYPRTALNSAMYLVKDGFTEGKVGEGQLLGSGLWVDLKAVLGEEIPVKIEWKCLDLFR